MSTKNWINLQNKARKNYQTYLGKMTSKLIMKQLKNLVVPTYFNSNHYVRTGNTIVLLSDEVYYQKYPEKSENVFQHHFHDAHLFLLDKLE